MPIATNRTQTIAKNTVLLYIRSIVTILLSIYTSRVLLDTLGVENYGTYNLVGGVVAMFLSMKSVFAASVQRFLNYEKGQGNIQRVQEIFSTSVIIHLGISALFVILVECIGMYYIKNVMVIPEGMQSTTEFVFHCSVAATAIAIMTIPYDAVIIANEKMNFYAYLSIGDAILKLLIVFVLPILPFEYLCSYAFLILCISLCMRAISMRYSKRFPECEFKRIWRKKTVMQLTTFAGWNFFGCMAYSLIEEGTNMILNFFGGVTANAARGIAYQIRNAVQSLSGNVVVASQPLIMQKAAIVEQNVFWQYIYHQSRAVFYIIAFTAFPIYVYAEEILQIWLTEVPNGTLSFVRVILIYLVVMSIQKPLDLAFKAYNRLTLYQIIDASVLLFSLPVVYVTLYKGAPLSSAFIVFIAVRIIDYTAVLLIARKQLSMKLMDFFNYVVIPCVSCSFVLAIIGAFFTCLPSQTNILILGGRVVIMLCVSLLALFLLVLNNKERQIIKSFIVNIMKRIL